MKNKGIDERVEYVCHKLGIPINLFLSPRRDGKLIEGRQIISAILRKKYTLNKIGLAIQRDHSSVIHSLQKHEDNMIYEDYREKFKAVEQAYQLYFDELHIEMPIETYLNKQCIMLEKLIGEVRELRKELKESKQHIY